jgi:hypothetical protein
VGDAEAGVSEEAVGSATRPVVSQADVPTQAADSQADVRSQAVVAAISIGEDTTAAGTSMEGQASLLDSMGVHISTAIHIMDTHTALATVVAITTSGAIGFLVPTATHIDPGSWSVGIR